MLVILINTNVSELCKWMLKRYQTRLVKGTCNIVETPSLSDYLPGLKTDSTAHEIKTTTHQISSWYFKALCKNITTNINIEITEEISVAITE